MPVSAQTLFKRDGLPMDLWELDLESDGYLFPGESLLEVIKTKQGLYRKPFDDCEHYDSSIGEFPDDWTEEDFINHAMEAFKY